MKLVLLIPKNLISQSLLNLLRGYKLIGLNCKKSSGTVDFVVNLWNERMKKGFYTVGGSDVSNANMKVQSDYIKFKSLFDGKKVQTITSFLSHKEFHAIGLLHDKIKINSFSDFTLSKKQPNIKINDAIITQLKNYLVDLVVYGENSVCDKCGIFEKNK